MRFVGVDRLPARLSRFDAESFFSLAAEDIAAIKRRFRSDQQVGVALQLAFLRTAGRSLDRLAVVPKALLSHIGVALGTSAPTVASLQSIYKRRSTLYEHQLWARLHAGITDFDATTQSELKKVLSVAAADAALIEEFVRAAADWLYAPRTLLPAVLLPMPSARPHSA